MDDPFRLSGPVMRPSNGGRPRRLVVLLHGLGADGNDLIGLAPGWAGLLPDAEFVAPHAPFPCDMAPFGRQWFSLLDASPESMLAGARAAAPILDSFLDSALAERGLDDLSMALVGFSQGTMMALYVAPRRPLPCAALVGYSGALIGAESLATETRSRPPVLLVHGDADTVVPAEALPLAAESLREAGLAVETRIRPGLGHAIDADGIARGGAFLSRLLKNSHEAATHRN